MQEKFKLTPEEQEFFNGVFRSDMWPKFVEFLYHANKAQLQAVYKYDLTNGTDRELIIRKAQTDGGAALVRLVENYAKTFKFS